jgi:hypothetical protein
MSQVGVALRGGDRSGFGVSLQRPAVDLLGGRLLQQRVDRRHELLAQHRQPVGPLSVLAARVSESQTPQDCHVGLRRGAGLGRLAAPRADVPLPRGQREEDLESGGALASRNTISARRNCCDPSRAGALGPGSISGTDMRTALQRLPRGNPAPLRAM